MFCMTLIGFCGRAEMKGAERDADTLKIKVDSDRRRVEELNREKDILNKQSTKAEGSVHKQVKIDHSLHGRPH